MNPQEPHLTHQVFNDSIDNASLVLSLRVKYMMTILRDVLSAMKDVTISDLGHEHSQFIQQIADSMLCVQSQQSRDSKALYEFMVTYDSILLPEAWVTAWNTLLLNLSSMIFTSLHIVFCLVRGTLV